MNKLRTMSTGLRQTVILAPIFAPPADFFRRIDSADLAVLDTGLRYDKRQKAMHRTVVSGLAGPAFLTVPVSTPGTTRCRWDEVRVSGHGEWWRVMASTLGTLFGPTPFYGYYRDEIEEILSGRAVGKPVTDMNLDLIVLLCRWLGIDTPLSVSLDERLLTDPGVRVDDLRRHNFYASEGERSVLETLFRNGREF